MEDTTLLARLNDHPLVRRFKVPYETLTDRFLLPPGKYLVLAGLIVGMFSMDVEASHSYRFWSVLFGIGLASFLTTRFQRIRVEVDRKVPAKVTAGVTVAYAVLVRNTTPDPQTDLSIREELVPFPARPVLTGGIGGYVPRIGPGETVRVTLQAEFPRRGIMTLPRLRVERSCPFGLTRSGETFLRPSRVIVYPRTYPVASMDFTTARVHQPGGVPLSASVGESPEFVGLRDYRPGDPIRHICWKAWARTGQPVIREFEGEYFRRVALVLDTRIRRGFKEADHFEAAVSVLASVTEYFEQNEYIIDVYAAGPDIFYLQTGLGLSQMENVLDLLSCVEPSTTPSFPRLDEPLLKVLGRLSGVCLVVTDWSGESRDFHHKLAGEVPEVKVLLVRSGPPTRDPAADVTDPRMLRVIDPDGLPGGLTLL